MAPPPSLVVTGLIAGAPEGMRRFGLEELEALGLQELRTTTPWTAGMQVFSGVPLARLLQAVGAHGTVLHTVALNDYTVVIPEEDARLHGAFLATRLDGRPMRIRDRGPIWLVYPWSERPALDQMTYHERSIWQLQRIEVR
ncbi:molybdopterin-dependent oxidoreductase [Roseomonas sp. E05]|uniref:molybdopterin-dependent oxidoreductase n=1 Tax=Roseomonas sp. E05 TaxID=3046310 RepID=UPI0024BBB946|nr:molybdopterin-dependent oxidoreductase [Roseomonas sp. E05]MDJ0390813.1 molybdopterin-dependent oxidoreductase [Roseomonas sp. E05]